MKRICRERLSEPLHPEPHLDSRRDLRERPLEDLLRSVRRPQFAFGVRPRTRLKRAGLSLIKVLEFGVAGGAGLLNLSEIASRVARTTGVESRSSDSDGATGLPEPRDYRDHPDLYTVGTFPMRGRADLIRRLPAHSRLVVGALEDTVRQFIAEGSADAPIGFISVDVDYYFSAVDALKVLDGPPEWYLPTTTVYLDDVWREQHNPWCGELLAVDEFNESHQLRKIAPFTSLRGKRLFKNARWIDQTFTFHVLDHHARNPSRQLAAEHRA